MGVRHYTLHYGIHPAGPPASQDAGGGGGSTTLSFTDSYTCTCHVTSVFSCRSEVVTGVCGDEMQGCDVIYFYYFLHYKGTG